MTFQLFYHQHVKQQLCCHEVFEDSNTVATLDKVQQLENI
jgi:hypothetical protein